MKKLTRKEMRNITAGVTSGKYCYFVSSTCGTMCVDPTQPTGPFPPTTGCAAYSNYLNPACHFTYTQVNTCPAPPVE